MAAVNIEIQSVAPFDCKDNSSALGARWKKWLLSFQYFLVAKGVVNGAQKKALLLHPAGIEVQELYETLTDPGPTEEFKEDTATDFEETVCTLNEYFVTKLNEPYERHVFRSMAQQERETVSQFIARLRKQARNCTFVNPDVDIRDQVIDKGPSSELRKNGWQRSILLFRKYKR